MSSPWPTVRLGEVLKPIERGETPMPGIKYRQIGVKLWGKGAYERELIDGGATKYSQLFRAEDGDIIVNKIWARNGSVAVVPAFLSRCYGSSEFPMFEPKRYMLESRWVHWLTKTSGFWAQCDEKSQGTSGKNRIKPEQFLGVEIPLPSLKEQRQIIAKIEKLAAQIEDARTLHRQSAEEVEAVAHAVFSQLAYKSGWQMKYLSAVAKINPPSRKMKKLKLSDKVSFVPMKAVDEDKGVISSPVTREFHEVRNGYTRFENGDVIFARITPCMQNGKAALARNLANGVGFGSTEFHVIRSGKEVSAEWIYHLVRHKAFRDDAAEHFKGTAGQQRVPLSFLEKKLIPVPPLSDQHRTVAEMDKLHADANQLKRLQADTTAKLDALLPSILDKAFKGEL